jgi:hypothetical protein
MLQRRLRHREQINQLERLVASMPEFPIYKAKNGQFIIYMHGRQQKFASVSAARIGQLLARADWLRAR